MFIFAGHDLICANGLHCIEYRLHLLGKEGSTLGGPKGNFSACWQKKAGTHLFLYMLAMTLEAFLLATLLHIRCIMTYLNCW